jgi:O-antigen/teichoic acid export membrane protein
MQFITHIGGIFRNRRITSNTLFKSLSANALQQLSILLIQFLGVPVLIAAFGVEQYGEYLALSAIPSILLFADLGIGITLSNEMTIAYAAGKKKRAQIYASSFLGFTICVLLVVFLMGLLLAFFDIRQLFGLKSQSNGYFKLTFLGLLLTALGIHIAGVLAYYLRAINKNALGVYMLTTQRLSVFVVLWTAALLSQDVLTSVLVALSFQVIFVMSVFFYYHRKQGEYLQLTVRCSSYKLIKQSLRPALSYMLFPLSNKLLMNGLTIVVNKFLGPASVVLFVTTRTLSNMLRQANTAISNSVWPEFTIAYGKRDIHKLKRLFYGSLKASLALASCLFLISICFGKIFFKVWLGTGVTFDYLFYILMIGSAVFSALWTTAIMLPTAISKFKYAGRVYLLATLICMSMLVVLGMTKLDIFYPLALIQLLMDIGLLICFYPYSKKVLTRLEEKISNQHIV